MKQQTMLAAFCTLFRGINEVARRANEDPAGIPLPDGPTRAAFQTCILRAPEQEAALPKESLVYLVRLAERISLAVDLRKEQTPHSPADGASPLESVFLHMRGSPEKQMVPFQPPGGPIPYPTERVRLDCDVYRKILTALCTGISGLSLGKDSLVELLSLLEDWTTGIPSGFLDGQRDVSLYDRLKIAAALASCVSEYLEATGRTDLRGELIEKEAQFRQEQAFILFSADLSGIQTFLYAVTSVLALRSLRSRSFYLELLMEHTIDELLDGCGLTRANLLYSGGGHCYLLLPNTPETHRVIEQVMGCVRQYFMDHFGTELYLAWAHVPCSANDLINCPAERAPYQARFRELSHRLTQQKLTRYSAAELRQLNGVSAPAGSRECKVCGRSGQLNGENLCPWCQRFLRLSKAIQEQDIYWTGGCETPDSLPLPSPDGTVYLAFSDVPEIQRRLKGGEKIRRLYTKNRTVPELPCAIRLYVGDYHASNLMEELADQATGIRRLAVCRADVDNLGATFTSGLEQPGISPEQQGWYMTLSRSATLSRQLSVFFKHYINRLLRGSEPDMEGALPVNIVYSGGDDIFLVGAWDGVLKAALRIQHAFQRFTGGSLTISAGMTLHPQTYPIRRAAAETEELETEAKSLDGKNAISLFAAGEGFVYHWDTFTTRVLGEKLSCVRSFFATQPDEDARGNAFLHRLLDLLRHSSRQINAARFAYLLSRLEPVQAKPEVLEAYRNFAKNLGRWYRQPKDRGELITAMYLYVYETKNRRHCYEQSFG